MFLWLTGRLAPLWLRLGADPRALRLILDAKLKMGDRSLQVMGMEQSNSRDYSGIMYFFLFLFGCLFIALYLAFEDQPTAVGLIFTFVSVYLGFMLVTEMSEHLFDLRDLTILYSRPITDATLSLSRGLLILTFTAKFALPLLLPLGLVLLFLSPLLAVLYFFLSILIVAMTVSFTLGLYLSLLRRVPTHRLRRALGYLQIGLSTFFVVGYQLPNLLNLSSGGGGEIWDLHIAGTWWGFVWPGFWLGGIWDLVTTGGNLLSLSQALLALFATAASVAYYLRQSGDYGSQLMGMRLAGSAPETSSDREKRQPGREYLADFRNGFGRLFTRTGAERAGYHFTWAIMGRDLKFKQQVYPTLLIPVFLAVALVARRLFFGGAVASDSGFVITGLYIFALLLILPLSAGRMSDNFRAAWVLRTNPVANRNVILYGQLMAVIGQLFLPLGLFIYLCVLVVTGPESLDDILLSAAVVLLSAVVFQLTERTLPFSHEKQAGDYNAFGPMIIVTILAGVAGLVHYGLTFLPYGVPAAAAVAWVVCLLSFRTLRVERA